MFLFQVSSIPLLQNAPAALINLAASASSSASSSQAQPYTNIADLRRKHEKIQQIQGKDELENEEDGLTLDDEMNTNEANPSFLQKKINKILAKLRLLSEISQVFQTNNENSDIEPPEEFDSDGEMTTIKETTNQIDENVNSTSVRDVEEVKEQSFQKAIYLKSGVEPPIRFTLDLKDTSIEDNSATTEPTSDKQKGRFGQVGIFFAEILGSIVALAYGAAMQFNHLTQGTIEPPTALDINLQ